MKYSHAINIGSTVETKYVTDLTNFKQLCYKFNLADHYTRNIGHTLTTCSKYLNPTNLVRNCNLDSVRHHRIYVTK